MRRFCDVAPGSEGQNTHKLGKSKISKAKPTTPINADWGTRVGCLGGKYVQIKIFVRNSCFNRCYFDVKSKAMFLLLWRGFRSFEYSME